MTEDDVKRLFNAAVILSERYGISLIGKDSCVPIAGPDGELDARLSDTEHVIHELAHCTLMGLTLQPGDMMKELATETAKYHEHLLQLNEIETFGVTIKVLQELGLEVAVDDFLIQLHDFAIHGWDEPFGFDADKYVISFPSTCRGGRAVSQIVYLMTAEGGFVLREGESA